MLLLVKGCIVIEKMFLVPNILKIWGPKSLVVSVCPFVLSYFVHGARCTIFWMFVCHIYCIFYCKGSARSLAECVAMLFAHSRLELQVVGSDPKAAGFFGHRGPVAIAHPPDSPRRTGLSPRRGRLRIVFFAHFGVFGRIQSYT